MLNLPVSSVSQPPMTEIEWKLREKLDILRLRMAAVRNQTNVSYSSVLVKESQNFFSLLKERLGAMREVIAVVIVAMAIASLLGNALVCCVLYRRRSLRTVTNIFLLNLSVAQMILACVAIPINLLKIFVIFDNWSLGNASCTMAYFTNSLCIGVSSFTLVCIAVDRYRVIVSPLKPRFTKRAVKLMIAACWIASVLLGLLNCRVLFPQSSTNQVKRVYEMQDSTVCAFMPLDNSSLRLILSCVSFLTQYVLPQIVIVVIYARIIHTLWIAKTVFGGASLGSSNGDASGGAQGIRIVTRKKTIVMLVVIMLLFFISWSPIHLYVISSNWRTVNHGYAEIQAHAICYWLAMSNIWYNPIIYAWLNGKFRRSLALIVCACQSRRRGGGGGGIGVGRGEGVGGGADICGDGVGVEVGCGGRASGGSRHWDGDPVEMDLLYNRNPGPKQRQKPQHEFATSSDTGDSSRKALAAGCQNRRST